MTKTEGNDDDVAKGALGHKVACVAHALSKVAARQGVQLGPPRQVAILRVCKGEGALHDTRDCKGRPGSVRTLAGRPMQSSG